MNERSIISGLKSIEEHKRCHLYDNLQNSSLDNHQKPYSINAQSDALKSVKLLTYLSDITIDRPKKHF